MPLAIVLISANLLNCTSATLDDEILDELLEALLEDELELAVELEATLVSVLDDAGVDDVLDVLSLPHANKPKPNNAIKLSFKICFFIFRPPFYYILQFKFLKILQKNEFEPTPQRKAQIHFKNFLVF